ncbi:HNH endonuclease [Klebsiella pneumoniae]|nr:HNH endonuclease [Klebsiella pneumoniae]
MGEISVKTGNNARNGGKNSLNRLIRCVCGKKIGPDPRNFNQRVSLGRNDLLIRTFPNGVINGLGGRVQKQLGRFEVKGVGKIASGTKFITVMKSREIKGNPKRNLWTIREELVQAIKELDFFSTNESSSIDFYSDNDLITALEESNHFDVTQTFEYSEKAKPKKAAIEVKNGLSYPRSKSVSKNALNKADYKCEINCDHPTFRRRNSPLNYTEPHHIVPMSKQDYFENSLDVEENIISLCCNCHKQIHLGKGFENMLRKIYAERKDVLKKAGIEILLEDLILFYKMEGN